ncbi:MAG: aminoacyl-tRNA hydrolase [Jatrophihabitans sp.]
MADDRFLVVGLGNPGPKYEATRHNAGFLVLDLLGVRLGGRFKTHKASGGRVDAVEGRLAGVPVVLAKPRSYMNESGGPVNQLARFYRIPIERIVVVHDELDIPFGTLRLKCGGGDGGHNGLRSTTSALSGNDYVRVRFGIGRPPGRQDLADYVLRDFPAAERKDLGFEVDRAADAVETLLTDGLAAAQNRYH